MVPVELMPDFAEVCGIHAGDGWMSSYTNEIGYGTSPKEEQYFQEVLQLYSKIFSPKHVRILRRLAVEFRFCSKEGQALLQRVGFPKGRKLDNLHIPDFIFQNDDLIKRFLKGVVDTDGVVYWRKSYKNHYLTIWMVTASISFAEDLAKALVKLGYHPQISSIRGTRCDGCKRRRLNRIILMRHSEIKRFIEEIGFRNNTRWNQVAKRFQDLRRYYLKDHTTTFLSTFRIIEDKELVV